MEIKAIYQVVEVRYQGTTYIRHSATVWYELYATSLELVPNEEELEAEFQKTQKGDQS